MAVVICLGVALASLVGILVLTLFAPVLEDEPEPIRDYPLTDFDIRFGIVRAERWMHDEANK